MKKLALLFLLCASPAWSQGMCVVRTLNTLTLTTTTFAAGQAAGTVLSPIIGLMTSTAVIEASDTSGIFAVSGSNLVAGPNYPAAAAGTYSTGLTETSIGASNSPHTSPLTLILSSSGGTHYYMTNASGGFILNASNGYIQIQ